MRRMFMLSVCAVLLHLVTPEPAHAWWEYIEPYSGPGPFYGVSLDARLLCIVDRAEGPKAFRVPSALGVLTSSCRVEANERRRAAIDLGARFVWADDNSRFANGDRISLTT